MNTIAEPEPTIASAVAAAKQAYLWSAALASPGRHIGPNLIPCRADRTPLREWRVDYPPGHEQSIGRVAYALRRSRAPNPKWRAQTYSIAPASDGIVVIDVDDMRHLARVLSVFGESPVYMNSRSGKVHLYYQGPAVPTTNGLWGNRSIDVKGAGSMIHVAGDGAYPYHQLRDRGPMGWLRPYLPPFRVDVYEEILENQRAARPSRRCADDVDERFATTPCEVDRLRRYMEVAGPAVAGNCGHDHTLYLLRNIGDLGASESLALELALDWDERNEPPWGPTEIRRAVADAYRSRRDPIGWRMRSDSDTDDATKDELQVDATMLRAALAALE